MKEINIEEILLNNTDLNTKKHVGFVSIIGRPNTGKSTFVNSILGEKVSITSNIPQTTRKKILGIYNDENSQIIFIDTPGIHKSEKLFNKKIIDEAINSIKDADLILYFISSNKNSGEEEKYIEELIIKTGKPILKVYTKIDLINVTDISNKDIKISSKTGEGLLNLIKEIKKYLPIGHLLYPENYYTTQNIFFRIDEIIREKIFLNTKEEIPHSIYVKTEEIEDLKDLLKIVSYIYTDTESQKLIIIGKGGGLLTKIGTEARYDIENIFQKKVFLAIRVKVKKNWKKDEKIIKNLLS